MEANSTRKDRINLARAWLCGYVQIQRNSPSTVYIEKDSELDNKARMSLAQLLVNGEAPAELLHLLALAIAPNDEENQGYGLELYKENESSLHLAPSPLTRTLDFVKRSRSRETDEFRNGHIVGLVLDRLHAGENLQKAYESVAYETCLSSDSIRKICMKYKEFMRFLGAD